MKIIKRNGSEVDFDLNKIAVAVTKANAACEKEELSASQIKDIAEYVEFKIQKANRALSVEEIQDIVENQIMAQGPLRLQEDMLNIVTTEHLSEKQIQLIIRFYHLLNATTKRLNRKIQIKTQP